MPATPDQRRLRSTLYIARLDGWSLVVLAGLAALYGAFSRQPTIALIGSGIALCGGLEVSAARRLQRRDSRALWILPTLQLTVLALVLNYAWYRWHHADGELLLQLLPAISRQSLEAQLPDADDQAMLLTIALRIIAVALALGAVLCQGGLALWYRIGFAAIRRAASENSLAPDAAISTPAPHDKSG